MRSPGIFIFFLLEKNFSVESLLSLFTNIICRLFSYKHCKESSFGNAAMHGTQLWFQKSRMMYLPLKSDKDSCDVLQLRMFSKVMGGSVSPVLSVEDWENDNSEIRQLCIIRTIVKRIL